MHLLVWFGCVVSTNITGALHLALSIFIILKFQLNQRQHREMFVAIAVCLGF